MPGGNFCSTEDKALSHLMVCTIVAADIMVRCNAHIDVQGFYDIVSGKGDDSDSCDIYESCDDGEIETRSSDIQL